MFRRVFELFRHPSHLSFGKVLEEKVKHLVACVPIFLPSAFIELTLCDSAWVTTFRVRHSLDKDDGKFAHHMHVERKNHEYDRKT